MEWTFRSYIHIFILESVPTSAAPVMDGELFSSRKIKLYQFTESLMNGQFKHSIVIKCQICITYGVYKEAFPVVDNEEDEREPCHNHVNRESVVPVSDLRVGVVIVTRFTDIASIHDGTAIINCRTMLQYQNE